MRAKRYAVTPSLLAVAAVYALATLSAWGLPIGVATDKTEYLPLENIFVYVTAYNPAASEVTLGFSSSLQASYQMDGVYDWKSGKAFLTVLTEVRIPRFGSYTWAFLHDWNEYCLRPGLHWVVGEVVGYGYSAPAYFTVLAPGDCDRNGIVDYADYQTLEANYGSGSTWGQGDFNRDNQVTFADYQLLEEHFSQHIPEPATLSLLALGGLGMLRRRE